MISNLVWRETIFGSVKEFYNFKGRNVLALVGIIIGTAAVIAILHIGHNARTEAVKEFKKLGTDILGAMVFGNNMEMSIPENQIFMMPDTIPNISKVSAIINTGGEIRIGRQSFNANVYAVTDEFYSLSSTSLEIGRFTYNIDGYSPYAVIGQNIKSKIESALHSPVEIGELINVNNQSFEIIGILNDTPQNNVLRTDLNDGIIIPYKAARRIGATRLSGIALKMIDQSKDQETIEHVVTWLREQDKEININISSASQIIGNVDAQLRIYAYLLLGIGSISLLVSGVGIMNVMLISVLERRHEIGLRRSIGASRLDIIVLFLSNAIILCFVGSFLGLILGTVSAYFFSSLSGWEFSPSIYAIPLGIVLALVVGLFFGIYPAVRASKLDIVTALRSD